MSPESKAIIHHEAVNKIQMRALELAQYAATIRVDLLIEAKVGQPIVVTVSEPESVSAAPVVALLP